MLSMIETPIANRLHIGIFGKRNAGKSSFINALTGQNISIVSEIPGTTTDPVGKTMEISGIGPVFIYDTAGIDDAGELGTKRVEKTKAIMKKIDLAILITTYSNFDNYDFIIIDEFKKSNIPFIVLFNKIDIEKLNLDIDEKIKSLKDIKYLEISCNTGLNINKVKKLIVEEGKKIKHENSTILGDLIKKDDIVILVVPIDLGAPKGRLILPQVQVIRDILDNNSIAVTVKETELKSVLNKVSKPKIVICDSQVVKKVAEEVPEDIKLTTFSILYARLKGDLAEFVKGVNAIKNINNGDKVLILEACTHHPSPDDIGRVKIPRWIKDFTGKDIIFDINAGPYVDKDLSKYKMIISCGGCMINKREMLSRINNSKNLNIPITNYGIIISYLHGVLHKTLALFPYEKSLLKD